MEIGWLMPPNFTHKKCQPAGVRPKEAPPTSSTFRFEQRTAAHEHEDEIIKIRKTGRGMWWHPPKVEQEASAPGIAFKV